MNNAMQRGLLELPPLGLYIHMPWCVRKCPYCDFNSHELKQNLPEADYISALLSDLEHELPNVWGRSIHSIFIGGGTPSLFSPESLDRLLSELRSRLNFPSNTEITLEANPGTVDSSRFTEFRATGINRLSLGVQSFMDDHLVALGRIHNASDAIKATEAAHSAGFENINLDLMYGLPKQTPQQAVSDIQTAIELAPTHLSHYQLTIEPNTWFYQHPPATPQDDELVEFEELCRSRLAEHGYQRYEISAFARTGHACRHNLNYWQFGDYLGIGAGAHGKRTDVQANQIIRQWKCRHPREYMAGAANTTHIAGKEVLDQQHIALEFMLNAMRLTAGIETELFARRTGLPISFIIDILQDARNDGLLDWDLQRITPSAKGSQFLNELLERFLPDHAT